MTSKNRRTRVTKQSFCVEITVRQFLNIEKRDDKDNNTYGLLSLLESIGCYDIEYNGHIGPNVFYSLDHEQVSEELLDVIVKAVINYAEGRKL